jgi:hypothetical protein
MYKALASLLAQRRIHRPLLWPRGQSAWLQIQRSGFDSRRYLIFKEVLGLEQGPLSLVSTIEEQTIPTKRQPFSVVPTFVNRWCHMVSVTDTYRRILRFLDRSRYFFFQSAPQLYSRGRAETVPDPLLIRKSGSAGN